MSYVTSKNADGEGKDHIGIKHRQSGKNANG